MKTNSSRIICSMRSLVKRNTVKGPCIGFIIASLFLTGCVTVHNKPYVMQPIELNEEKDSDAKSDALIRSIMDPGESNIRIGDDIRLLTLDGNRRYTTVSDIHDDGIVIKSLFSKPKVIRNEEIVFLEKQIRRGSNHWSLFPILTESRENDESLSTEQLQDELIRVDVLRRAINREISDLSWESLNTVFALQLQDLPTKHLDRNRESRSAANARMIKLLDLWQTSSGSEKLLPGGESVESIFNELDELNAKKVAGEVEETYDDYLKRILNRVVRKRGSKSKLDPQTDQEL